MKRRSVVSQIVDLVPPFWRSERRTQAWLLLVGLVAFVLLLVAANVSSACNSAEACRADA